MYSDKHTCTFAHIFFLILDIAMEHLYIDTQTKEAFSSINASLTHPLVQFNQLQIKIKKRKDKCKMTKVWI